MYRSFSKLAVITSDGSICIGDADPPIPTIPIASPQTILNDNVRARVPGTNITRITATVTGNTGVENVTINLTPIRGPGHDAVAMTLVEGTERAGVWSIDTNADYDPEMLSCKDKSRGFFTFGCNSHICSNCSKNHTDKWAKSLQNALWGVPHRHAVLTIPDSLWHIVRNNRLLLKVLMDAAIAAINDTISRKHRNGRLTAGAVVVLHPFSRSMGNNSASPCTCNRWRV